MLDEEEESRLAFRIMNPDATEVMVYVINENRINKSIRIWISWSQDINIDKEYRAFNEEKGVESFTSVSQDLKSFQHNSMLEFALKKPNSLMWHRREERRESRGRRRIHD